MTKQYKSRRSSGDTVKEAAGETGNRPPQAPEVEAAVLGAMMIDEECVIKAIESLKEKCFYNPKLRLVFSSISTLFRERTAVDLVTVTERLRTDGALEAVGGPAKLAQLTEQVGSAANIDFYIKILQQKTIQRDLIEAGYGILKNAFDETCEVDRLIEESQSSVFQAVQGNISGGYVEIGDAVNRSMQRIQSQQNAHGLTGVPSGFPTLDGITMGWQPGNLIIIGARPSHGKTALGLNMARFAAVDQGIPVAFFSLEMSDMELADRLIATESGLPSDKLRGKIPMEKGDWQHLEESIRQLTIAPLYIDETPALNITEFSSKAKRMVMEKGVKIIFVDYLGLMTAPASNASYREQVISEVSRQLKTTAKELKIPVIAMAQLNRNIIGRLGSSMGRPQLSDLRDSGSIEQDADIVIFINRPGLMGKTDDVDDAELIIAKNRAGRLADIDMRFIGDQVRFVEDTGGGLLATARALSDAKKQEYSQRKSRAVVLGSDMGAQRPWSPFDMGQALDPLEEFEAGKRSGA